MSGTIKFSPHSAIVLPHQETHRIEQSAGAAFGFQFFFTDAKRLPRPEDDFGEKVLAVEFLTKLPWVI